MVKPKTHFEQVPLELVKKIVEKQDRMARATAVLCAICEAAVELEHCKIDEAGEAVHDRCYVAKLSNLPNARNGRPVLQK